MQSWRRPCGSGATGRGARRRRPARTASWPTPARLIGQPAPRVGPLDGAAVRLQAPDPRAAAGQPRPPLTTTSIVVVDGRGVPPASVPVTTVPAPVGANDRSTHSRGRSRSVGLGAVGQHAVEGEAQRAQAGAVQRRRRPPPRRRRGTCRRGGRPPRAGQLGVVGVDQPDLGQRDHAVTTRPAARGCAGAPPTGASSPRWRPRRTGTTRPRPHPGEHVLDEPDVAGHVDERDHRARRQRGPREAQVDREPPALLLVETVGVGAGEGEHQRRLPVVDVPGGGDDPHGHGCGRAAGPGATGRSAPARRRAALSARATPWGSVRVTASRHTHSPAGSRLRYTVRSGLMNSEDRRSAVTDDMPLPKSAAAATRCNGVGSTPGDDRHAQPDPVDRRAGLVEVPGHEAVLDPGVVERGVGDLLVERAAGSGSGGGSTVGWPAPARRRVRICRSVAEASRVPSSVLIAAATSCTLRPGRTTSAVTVSGRRRDRPQELDRQAGRVHRPRRRPPSRRPRPRRRAVPATGPPCSASGVHGPRAKSVGSHRPPSGGRRGRRRASGGRLRVVRPHDRTPVTAAATAPSSAGSTVRRSSTVRPPSTRAMTGRAGPGAAPQCGRRRALTPHDGISTPGSVPPPLTAVHGAALPDAERFGAAAEPVDAGRRHAPERQRRPIAPEVGEGDVLQGAEHESARTQCPVERVAGAGVDEVGPPGDDPGLRAAEELVAGEHHQGGAGGERLADRRLVAQPRRRPVGQPRAGGVEQPRAEVDHHRRADRGQLVDAGGSR